MKRYRCKKELILDKYDADGFYVDGEYEVVEVGEIYETGDGYEHLFVACEPAIRLERVHDKICNWIEIYPETLAEYFEEMTEGESNA